MLAGFSQVHRSGDTGCGTRRGVHPEKRAFDLDRDGVIVKVDGGSALPAGAFPTPF
jgi:hypothetical protein